MRYNKCVGVDVFGNAEVEAGIIDEDNHVGLPFHYVTLTECHIAEDGRQMEQYGNEAHIGQLPDMFHTGAPFRRHGITAEEAEVGRQ